MRKYEHYYPRWAKMKKDGVTLKEIAKAYHVGLNTVRNGIREFLGVKS